MPNQFPEEWKPVLKEYLNNKGLGDRDYPLAGDFPGETVILKFEDGSAVKFNYAFLLEGNKKVLVVSEHCGYHEFPSCILLTTKIRGMYI